MLQKQSYINYIATQGCVMMLKNRSQRVNYWFVQMKIFAKNNDLVSIDCYELSY